MTRAELDQEVQAAPVVRWWYVLALCALAVDCYHKRFHDQEVPIRNCSLGNCGTTSHVLSVAP